jgi:hypothetical protein
MSITLLDELAIEQPTLRKGIIQTLVESVMFQDRIPYETTGNLQVPVTYLSGIPTVPLRHINETATQVQASFGQLVETLHIFDTDIDIDPVLAANKNQIQPIEVVQTQAIVKALGYRVNDLLINGDPTVDAREPMGLKYRLTNDVRFNGQTVNAGNDASTVTIGVGPAAADANFLQLLNKLDELFYLLEFRKGTVLIVNRQVVLTIWAGLRKLKLLDTTRDQFDREIAVYRGVPIIDIGFKPTAAITGQPDAYGATTNQIIGNNQDLPTGGGAVAYAVGSSPMYAVCLGDDYFIGLQQAAMTVKHLGEIHTTPHFLRTNIRWVMNPGVPFQKRAIARLVGFDTTLTTAVH